MREKLIIEKSSKGRKSYSLPEWKSLYRPISDYIPDQYLRSNPAELPEVSEIDIVRHFTRLSHQNFSVDTNFYPLGSCTMKYNPKINEHIAGLNGFTDIHPLQIDESVQGLLKLLYHMEKSLSILCAMDAFTLQPAAGAHGELTGMMIIKAYHNNNGEGDTRKKVIVPDSSHGTNPSSAHLAGFEVVTIPSNEQGMVDIDKLKTVLCPNTAAFMLTNPNTLGVFDNNILEIAKLVHGAGALLYYDGANLNPLLSITRPGDMGFDVVHLNLHKTFSTPHGGGGPGSGPVGVKSHLIAYLPKPSIKIADGKYFLDYKSDKSIGKISTFYGNIGVILRAYTYILINGVNGLRKVSECAILNANYLMKKLEKHFSVPYNQSVMHEFVISFKKEAAEYGVRAIDAAKWLIDKNIHPPTVYFPLIVEEAIMIEPTETETIETLDLFVEELVAVKKAIMDNPDIFHHLPAKQCISRPDEVRAARNPVTSWRAMEEDD
ncbi:aminomethyl-transferring glycine dehydrogenase subunit GcvPB [bacterium]|nr:aminomethyl-transferring glycine dehydrogenase subunit GcvPB [bacterium]